MLWESPYIAQSVFIHRLIYGRHKEISPLLSFLLSFNSYLSKYMFISLRGPRGACEGLVKEHGMLMVWKRYE